MKNNFDLFRLNCLLNDSNAVDFKNVILSIVCERLYDNQNQEISLTELYTFITNEKELGISLDKDYFKSIIESSNYFHPESTSTDVLLKLTSQKFDQIEGRIKEHSISKFIEDYISKNHLENKYIDSTLQILYRAVYENINTFSPKNVSTLIPNSKDDFDKVEIDIYNAFLDYNDHEKNIAIYTLFAKAIDFAILTSGKGVKESTKDIFKGKVFCLDTNIIFRVLGVGGAERKDTLVKLIKSCVHQGIEFQYSLKTYGEFINKLQQSVTYLKNKIEKNVFDTLGSLSNQEPQLFNDDFIIHYSRLRHEGVVKSPDQYETFLRGKFKEFVDSYSIKQFDSKVTIPEKAINLLSKHLFLKKREYPYGNRYTNSASKVDAYNIVYVKLVRGQNNYNYSDVKSYYLTTDRTLNTIMANESGKLVPETILPSQLFVLHNPYHSENDEIDYDMFLKFIKRRNTEFKYRGTEVLNYIETIRQHSQAPDNVRHVLLAYSDKRYENYKDGINISDSVNKLESLNQVIESALDKKITEGDKASQKIDKIYKTGKINAENIFFTSRKIVRIIDICLTILVIPISVLILKVWTNNLLYLIVGTSLIEGIKFAITSKTQLLPNLWELILRLLLKNSAYYKLTMDEEYLNNSMEKYYSVKGEVWKKISK